MVSLKIHYNWCFNWFIVTIVPLLLYGYYNTTIFMKYHYITRLFYG